MIWSALVTAFVLIPGAVVGVAAGASAHENLAGHLPDPLRIALSALLTLVGMFAGGALWGWSISRITRAGRAERMALLGGIAFACTATLVAFALGSLENPIVEQQRGPQLPVHNVFTLLFAPAAAVIAGVSGAALGVGAGGRALAGRLAWTCALAAGGAFVLVDLTMDALGWRVGAPGAAERATMLTKTFLGDLAAAIAGGAVIGGVLSAGASRDRRSAAR